MERVGSTDEMFAQVDATLEPRDNIELGERVVIVAGSPPGVVGTTNTLRIHRVGEMSGNLDAAGPRKHTLAEG